MDDKQADDLIRVIIETQNNANLNLSTNLVNYKKFMGPQIEKMIAQLKENADSSKELGRKVFWLNMVLALGTIIGAVATVLLAINAY